MFTGVLRLAKLGGLPRLSPSFAEVLQEEDVRDLGTFNRNRALWSTRSRWMWWHLLASTGAVEVAGFHGFPWPLYFRHWKRKGSATWMRRT